jgi:hypothetical protein
MCLEDMRLGKGRTPDPTVVAVATTDAVLGPDANRVALLVSINAISTNEPTGPTYVNDSVRLFAGPKASGTPFITASQPVTPFVLRVEDVGQLLFGAFSVEIISNSGVARICLTPIKSYADAPAIISGKP